MDDFFIVGNDRLRLLRLIPVIRDFLKNELGLSLHPDKMHLQEAVKGINFLGAVVKPYRRYLLDKTKRRVNLQVRCAVCQPVRQMTSTLNSYLGYMRHLNCRNFTRKLVERNPGLCERGRFAADYLKFIPYKRSPGDDRRGEVAGAESRGGLQGGDANPTEVGIPVSAGFP